MAGPYGKSRGKKKDEGLWLLSFCDLSFILMSFFVLLLSWSKIDKSKIENIQESMQGKKSLQVDNKGRPIRGQENLRDLSKDLEEIVNRLKMRDAVHIKYDADGLSVEFKDSLLFSSGSADATSRSKGSINDVMRVIAGSPQRFRLVVEGHTDDVPLGDGKFRDNWELSAARGFSLLSQLRSRGINEDRMSIIAYAHTRPKVPYRGLQGERLAMARANNRRVVIRIE